MCTKFVSPVVHKRQLRQHYILKQILGGNIQLQMDEPPKMILDSAAGAGFWAFEIAQKYPESKVVAMDISLPTDSAQVNNGQPITPNVSFVFGDILNTPLPFADGTFDLVYQREVGAIVPIPYWKPLFEDFARILKPNGSVHLVEYDLRMPDCGPLTRKGNKAVDEFALATGYNMKFTEGFEGHLLSVGFTDVRIQEFPIPVGEWPEDEIRLQQGFLVKSVFKGILKMVKPRLAPFLELTLDEYDQYCVAVMDEIERNKGLTEWKVITARKA
ncbi:hypothetical protein O0I10_005453 [Lichtheimia ornata]|uniref:Methyltransferase domain-containing protein n=1 Tax=Lichtheimia ornata TaxID=688661 RepID=A0AAD7XVN3_9FUNG|nr:uncharacterized protein O0I10_005453 [Lichtheimia ornata]KAJ8658729.1 hypothetical protein O0I10_005453 [Lichtheimia ornata]